MVLAVLMTLHVTVNFAGLSSLPVISELGSSSTGATTSSSSSGGSSKKTNKEETHSKEKKSEGTDKVF